MAQNPNAGSGNEIHDSTESQVDFPRRMFALRAAMSREARDRSSLIRADFDLDEDLDRDNPFGLGGRRSFVPVLGDIVWEPDLPEEFPFCAYICRLGEGREIGYVRVPHYQYDEDVAMQFEDLIARFERRTSAMVLDQVNNPGGSLFHMYAILSTLTDKPLSVPKHQVKVSPIEADEASKTVEKAEAGGPVLPELLAYSRALLKVYKPGGRNMTEPLALYGVAEVLPAKVPYTKRIVVLINELTFSAGEFLAAILQDNKRATLFGYRTAGAGGCVKFLSAEDRGGSEFGIEGFNITWTLAWRTSGEPIESNGVRPDVEYELTVDDLQHGFDGYRRAILAVIGT